MLSVDIKLILFGWLCFTLGLFVWRLSFYKYWLRWANIILYEELLLDWTLLASSIDDIAASGKNNRAVKRHVYEILHNLCEHAMYERISPYANNLPEMLRILREANTRNDVIFARENIRYAFLHDEWSSYPDQAKGILRAFAFPITNLVLFVVVSRAIAAYA